MSSLKAPYGEGTEMSTICFRRSPSPTESECSAAATPPKDSDADWGSRMPHSDAADDEPWCADEGSKPCKITRSLTCAASSSWHNAPPCTKSGVLQKEGYYFTSLKRRWFVLDGFALRYYEPLERGRPQRLKGVIPLTRVTDILAIGSELRIVTPNREYKLSAERGAGVCAWAEAIMHNLKVLPKHDGLAGTGQPPDAAAGGVPPDHVPATLRTTLYM